MDQMAQWNKSQCRGRQKDKLVGEKEDPVCLVRREDGIKEVCSKIRTDQRYVRVTGGGSMVNEERTVRVS